MYYINKKAFTLTELIVTITILSIITTISFISMNWYLLDTRNSQRISDLSQVKVAIKTYKSEKLKIPFPENYFWITNWWVNTIAWQWKLWKNISLSTIDEIPLDPKLNIEYLYSITSSKQEFQLAWTLEDENWGDLEAILIWDYHSVSSDLLPTLIVASNISIDITTASNKKLFIFNGQNNNLPYSFISGNNPISDWTIFSELLSNAISNNYFSQNSDFETCEEIQEWLKEIWNGTYQVRDEYWVMTNTGCTSF